MILPNHTEPDIGTHNEFYKNLFDHLAAVILVFDLESLKLTHSTKESHAFFQKTFKTGSKISDIGLKSLSPNILNQHIKTAAKKGKYVGYDHIKASQIQYTLSTLQFSDQSFLVIQFEKQLNAQETEHYEENAIAFFRATGPDKQIQYCNTAFVKLLGYKKKKSILGKPLHELAEFNSSDGLDKPYREYELVLNNEGTRWVMFHENNLTDASGESFLEGSFTDITALKLRQEELRKSEENLSLVVNNLDDIIYNVEVGDTDGGKFRYVSPQIENIFGISVEEYEEQVRKEGLIAFIHPDDWEAVKKMNKKIRRKKTPVSLVYRFKNRKTDNYHWIEENVYPILEDNVLTGKLGIVRDITQRKLSEEALRISEKRYRGLFERNLAGVFRITRKGTMLECNDSFAKILGYNDTKKLRKKSVTMLYFDQDERFRFYNDLMSKRVLTNYETCLKRSDGSEMWCLVNAGYNEEWDMIEGTLIDISELKITGEALIESERTLSTLLSNLPGMAYRCSIGNDWKMEFVSEGFKELTEYEPHQIIGNKEISFRDLIHKDYLNLFDDFDREDDSDQDMKFVYEYKMLTKSGKEKWVWERGEVVYNEKGEAVAFEGFISDITDRKKYEEKINTRKSDYQSQVDDSPFGIIIHKDGNIRYANRKALEMMDYNIDEKTGKGTSFQKLKESTNKEWTMEEFLLPEYHEQAEKRRQKLKKGKTLPYLEVKLKTKKNKIIDVETRSVVTRYDGEEMIQVVFNDITAKKQLQKEQARAQAAEELNVVLAKEIKEHKETQEKLGQNQRFTRNLIDSSLDMILAVDNENIINEVNQSAIQKFGYEHNELIGKKPNILYANKHEYVKVKNELNKNGRFIGEIQNIDKNGRIFSSVLSASMIKNAEGEVIGAMGISRDITEIKDVERVISKQSSTIKSIFESNSNMLIWIVNDSLEYVSYNNSFYNAAKLLIGKSPENGASIDRTIINRITKEERVHFISHFKRALSGTNQQFEIMLTDVRQNEFWLEIYLSPIILADGDIREVACLAHEITDKKLVERKMKESLKEKEILLKEVHHRVKNNLQVISSILNLQSSYIEDENTLSILRESQNRIKSMSFIHESLYQTKNFSSINFTDYIVNLTKNLVHSYQITSGNIEFKYEVEKIDLELDQAIPCGLIANELVSNALKYAFPDNSKGQIKLILSENENEISLGIEDNGVGLPKDIDHENTNTLGLQLVMTLVEQLDGNIDLKSENGTNYLITFERQNHTNNG